MISDRLFTVHLKVFNMANLFDRPMVDAPEKKWTQAWKIRLIQEKNPSVDHHDAQWIPAFAGMTKKDHSPRSHGFSPFSQNAPRHSREGGNP